MDATRIGPHEGLRTRFSRLSGFTLVELLIGLILLSLILLVLLNAIQVAVRVWSKDDKASGLQEAAIQKLIRRELSEAYPLTAATNRPTDPQVYMLQGKNDSIYFIAPLPHHLGIPGLYKISIRLIQGGQVGNSVEMSWQLFRGSIGEGPVNRHTLLDGVAAIRFEYFGEREGTQRKWYDDWQATSRWPELIRVSIQFLEKQRSWPDLVVATAIRSVSTVAP